MSQNKTTGEKTTVGQKRKHIRTSYGRRCDKTAAQDDHTRSCQRTAAFDLQKDSLQIIPPQDALRGSGLPHRQVHVSDACVTMCQRASMSKLK